jgi:NAD(P)-dependent dehydrogenase (short-subunit alcohol dehydrogenase family)
VDIAGSVALVTGGERGIGRAIADALADRGAAVVVADVDGRDVEVDLTREGEVERMIDDVARRHGRIDILVNNAGGYEEPVFPDAAPAHWRRTLELNLGAVMLAIQQVLPLMEASGRGAIVNVASSAGLGEEPYRGVEYAVAKAGVIRLTSALGGLNERLNVRVNCICPHTVATRAVLEQLEHRSLADIAPPPPTIVQPAEVALATLRLIEDDTLFGQTVVLWGEEP